MIFFTSDQHFGHANIIGYTGRDFATTEEMDTALVEEWNAVVGTTDIVYQLGDFTLLGPAVASKMFEQLNGKIRVIPGSHDKWMNGTYVSGSGFPVVIMPELTTIEISLDPEYSPYPLLVVLCHYAMRTWDRAHYGSIHLYGHSHGRLTAYQNSLDVGVDSVGAPISLVDALKRLNRGEIVEYLDPMVL